MKSFARFALVVTGSLLGLLSTACGDGEEGTWSDPALMGKHCGAFVRLPAAELFEGSAVASFELTLPATHWDWLNAHALDEEYVEAQLSYEGQDVGPVGLRFKGEHGTLALCIGEDGERLCPKLSMKLDFAHLFDDCRFYGARRLNLHSMQWDPTKLHERVAYDLYRQLDVNAPRSSWANVTVNGVSLGIFSMVEEVDQSFVDANWPKQNDGDLYKEAWPKNALPTYYHTKLETDPNRADTQAFLDFYAALTEADADDEALARVLDEHTDRARLARYLAVDDALINWDGATTFYVTPDDSWSGNHNYYWYRRPRDDKFQLVAWDLDGTLSVNKSIVAAPRWNELPDDCSKKYVEFGGDARVLAPGCNPVFRGLAADQTDYLAAVDELLAGPFSVAALETQIDDLALGIEPHVATDPLSNHAAWRSAVEQLRASVPILHERLARLRRGESVQPLRLQLGENDFEATTAYAVAAGAASFANPTSHGDVSWLKSEASGQECLRLDFELRNEAAPWQQWAKLRVGMASGTADVTAYRGLRIRARADRPRFLGVQLVSAVQSRANLGIQNGWEQRLLSTEFTEFDLLFANATIPSWASDEFTDAGAPLAAVLAEVGAIEFLPACSLCSGGQGFIAEPGVEPGFLEIDSVTFF